MTPTARHMKTCKALFPTCQSRAGLAHITPMQVADEYPICSSQIGTILPISLAFWIENRNFATIF